MRVKSLVLAGLTLPLMVPSVSFAQQSSGADAPPSCAAEVSWLGDSAEAATLSGSAIETAVRLGSGGTRTAAFRVTGDERPVRVELGDYTSGDPYLTILNAQGGTVNEGDDYEGTLASRLEQILAPGDYCAVARDVSNGALTATLRVSELDNEPLVRATGRAAVEACGPSTQAEVLDEAELGKSLSDFTTISRSFAGTEGARYLRFTLPAGANLRITATSSDLDPFLTLYDNNGNQVAENDDADGMNSRLDMLGSLPAGTYCIAAAPLSAGSGQITLALGGVDPSEVLRDAYRQAQMPPPADSDYPVETLDISITDPQVRLLGGNAIWFRFDTDQRQVLMLNAYAAQTGMDTRLVLFDAFGRQIQENDDANGTTDPQIGPVLLDPGSYRLAVVQLGQPSATGQMRPVTLGVQRFLPAK